MRKFASDPEKMTEKEIEAKKHAFEAAHPEMTKIHSWLCCTKKDLTSTTNMIPWVNTGVHFLNEVLIREIHPLLFNFLRELIKITFSDDCFDDLDNDCCLEKEDCWIQMTFLSLIQQGLNHLI